MAKHSKDQSASTTQTKPDYKDEASEFEISRFEDEQASEDALSGASKQAKDSDFGPDAGPGRRATDLPFSEPSKWFQHLAIATMLIGLLSAFLLVAADGIGRFLGVGLAFFAGGLAVWRVVGDDIVRLSRASDMKDDIIRRLLKQSETLEDEFWELRESDERQASILATLGDIVIRRDHEGIITYINSAADDVFGTERSLKEGAPMILPYASQASRSAAENNSSATYSGEMGFKDLCLETAHGKRWFSRIDVPVREKASERQLIQTVLRDVTQRREIEQELLAARHSAENSSEAKSRFLATVSHEIRTPLNGVLGMAALLRDTRLTKEQSAYIEALETSGETLLLLIDEVLDFSKVEAGKLDIHAAPVRVGALVESVVELLAPKAHAKELEIGAMVDASLPDTVTLDATRVRQILFNLIGNGVKFTDEGGIAVELIGSSAASGGSIVHIEVRDTGIGFDKEQAERLFQEFEQVDHGPARKFGGTGLGLAIAQRLAGLMGGKIAAKPGETGGAIFRVSLPVPEQLRTLKDDRIEKIKDLQTLFVTNSRIECPLLAKRLQQHGADVSIVAPGSEELEEKFLGADLIVVDNAALVDSGGWLATARLAGCNAPAIVMISPPERERLDELREAGYAAYLIRPVRIETIAQIFAGILDENSINRAWDVSAEPVSSALISNRNKATTRPLRLLVAEDNDINRLLSEAVLRKLGHVPVMVVDGEKAVEEAASGSYDAILMDLHMPGVDGFEAIRQIRRDEQLSNRKPVPVLIVTADVMKDARDKAREVGAAGYLTKPLSVDAISEALHEVGNT